MTLSPEEQGTLVITVLNLLPHPQDVAEQNEFSEGCCPQCCAPCDLLRTLRDDGRLDQIVRWAPKEMYVTNAWWLGSRVDRDWLKAVWHCTSRPPCEEVNE